MHLMKILVLSDSHGELRYMEQAVFDVTPDHIIHLGDKQQDCVRLQEKFCRIPFTSVPGNCDLYAVEPQVVLTELGGVRFLITHGHLHGVKGGMLRFSLAAREAGAQVALYGHTHIAACERDGETYLLNPGAAGGPRPSYGVVEIDHTGGITCRVVRF